MTHARHLLFAEGRSAGLFDPLDQIRPPCLLRNGAVTIAERWIALLQPQSVSAAVRPWIAGQLRETLNWQVNAPLDDGPDELWIIAGAPSPVAFDPSWRTGSAAGKMWTGNGHSVAVLDRRSIAQHKSQLNAWVADGGQGGCPVDLSGEALAGEIIGPRGLWDLIDNLRRQLAFDWETWWRTRANPRPDDVQIHPAAVLIDEAKIACGAGVRLGPHTVVDASQGPVILDTRCVVEPFTRLEGPVYVGPHSRLTGGKIGGGCAFGPACKLGGEIEASIVQGFSNKVHEGFFGHGFIGEWVNLGALTTNSDLKNTYGTVRVVRGGTSHDTGAIKVGSYVSDHTKTGIGVLLPTGATIGAGTNIIAGGLTPKHLPAFMWGGQGQYEDHDIDRMITSARVAISRRTYERQELGYPGEMTEAEETALRELFKRTRASRAAFTAAT